MELPLVPAKKIIQRVKDKSWFGLDYNMNLYRGCCHGCVYCDSRSECYGIADFDTVCAKENALRLIRDELRRLPCGVVATGSMSDPYNPFEAQAQLTRHALELLAAYGFGAAIATKSNLITRDINVLREIAAAQPVLCKLTITTTDDALAAKIEPHAPRPSARLDAIRQLAQAGLYSGILLMPVLPFLEDSDENITAIVRAAAEAGARFIYPAFGMTLRTNQRAYYLQKLETLFPGEGLCTKYAAAYGTHYRCTSGRAAALWKIFSKACAETGLLYRMQDIVAGYRVGYAPRQLTFL